MPSLVGKIFNLSDIRHPWLLIISMLNFVLSLYNNKIHPDISSTMEQLTYGGSLICALIWSILNYVGHIRINAFYRKHDSIEGYVDSLPINRREKEDLRVYLDDFVKDLKANGKTESDAIKTAIAQFQVQEFTCITDQREILELPVHHYLLGYSIIFAGAIVVIKILIDTAFSGMFLLKAVEFMLILYSIAFVGLLFLYRLADVLAKKKW